MNRVLEIKNNYVILEEEQYIRLYSYRTYIGQYNYETKKLEISGRYWDYSNTTLKHVKNFIDYYTNFEYKTKKAFEKLIENDENIEVF